MQFFCLRVFGEGMTMVEGDPKISQLKEPTRSRGPTLTLCKSNDQIRSRGDIYGENDPRSAGASVGFFLYMVLRIASSRTVGK